MCFVYIRRATKKKNVTIAKSMKGRKVVGYLKKNIKFKL